MQEANFQRKGTLRVAVFLQDRQDPSLNRNFPPLAAGKLRTANNRESHLIDSQLKLSTIGEMPVIGHRPIPENFPMKLEFFDDQTF